MIEALYGNILNLCDQVGAVVNPANSYGSMGGGVAYAIKQAGGKEIEDRAKALSPIMVGNAVLTSGGKLKCKVIHAPTMRLPGKTTIENVAKATKAALQCAYEHGLTAVAIPGMGTGTGGVKGEEAAKAMIEEGKKFEGKIERIIFIDLDAELVAEWKKQLGEVI